MRSNNLTIYLAKKTVKLLSLLIAVCIVTFSLIELSPIDPVTAYVGTSSQVGAEQRELIAEQWGLNRPPVERFLSWLGSAIKGDWGTSTIFRRPVMEVIGQKFLVSLALMAVAWTLSGIFGFFLGILAGIHSGKPIDKGIRGFCHILMSTPSFWLGMLLIMVFAYWLGWFPVGLSVPIGVIASEVTLQDKLLRLVLPALTLTVTGISSICMHTRNKTVEILKEDYVVFAKARGESKKEIIKHHVLRNISLPAITLQFLAFGELFGGAVFVEQVFSYPGLGQTAVQAGLRGDAPLLMGITVISVLFVYVGNTTADLLYRVIDPRIKKGGRV